MRPIKFRGKRTLNGAWVYGDLVTDVHGKTCICTESDHRFEAYKWVEVDPKTVGQFTGLRGKNEKDIYEGDVIKDPFFNEPAPVVYTETHTQFTYGGAEFNVEENVIEIEVIGNKFDHPHLLKRENSFS